MSRGGRPKRDEGFALLGVLWALVGIATLALVARLAARDAVLAAGNRRALEIASWRAEGCLAQVRAVFSSALKTESASGGRVRAWAGLDSVLASRAGFTTTPECDIRVHAPGAVLDVNTAEAETLWRLVSGLGATAAGADSLVDALLDWRDSDSIPRARGAEAAWYRAEKRPSPRNAPLADIRELARVRGFDRLAGIDTVAGVEALRIPLNRAPLAVLAALPGLGREAAARIEQMRGRGQRLDDLAQLQAMLSVAAGRELMKEYGNLVSRVTPEPEVWEVTIRALGGTPRPVSVLEVRLGRAPNRLAVLRRRTWLE